MPEPIQDDVSFEEARTLVFEHIPVCPEHGVTLATKEQAFSATGKGCIMRYCPVCSKLGRGTVDVTFVPDPCIEYIDLNFTIKADGTVLDNA